MGRYAQEKLLFLMRFLISDVGFLTMSGMQFVTEFLGSDVMI